MKKRLSLLLVMLMLVSLFTGCGQSQEQEAQGGGQTTLTIVRATDIDSLDPVLVNYSETIALCDLLYDTLLIPSDDGTELLPNMCTDYTMSEDGLTWTFHLKEGMKFSDGSTVTADDWVFTFQRLKDTPESLYGAPATAIVSMEAPDDNTLILYLDTPRAAFASELTLFSMAVESRAYWEEFEQSGADIGTYQPLSTGPFKVKEWKRGEYVLMEKNEYCPEAEDIPVEQVKVQVVADDNARVTMLRAGEADVVMDLPYSTVNTLKGAEGIEVQIFNTAASRYIIFNTLKEPLDDIRVRKALRMGTNLQELIDMVTYGYAVTGGSYLPPGDLYRIDITPDEYDVEAAKALLAEAGYGDGLTMEMWVRSGNAEYEQIATILKQQWEQIGVTLDLVTMETAALVERQEEMQHTMVIGRWTEDINDPSQLSDYFWNYPVTQGYYTGWNDAELQQISLDSMSEMDPDKRAELYRQLQEARYDYCAELCLYNPQSVVAVSDRVEGFVLTSLTKIRLDQLSFTD